MSTVSATGPVVVGVDGSEQSKQALRLAAEEATAHSATLEVVHAWNFLDQPGPTFDPEYGEDKARARASQIVDEVLGDDRPADVVVTVVNDHPAPALVHASQGARMLVVGARGLGGFKGMLLGSVSQHLVHHAHCPLLLAR
ncbi:universal stress protein [Desertimonas flava]|jgi:nucleotide-binding universal stress UspA family protein|uniref:universal stress protein n=1 Tax=Desertimonas flava TaxID=2064846 RepID=UPI000E347043|nr:universal stress protein [Desertimonas flava]